MRVARRPVVLDLGGFLVGEIDAVEVGFLPGLRLAGRPLPALARDAFFRGGKGEGDRAGNAIEVEIQSVGVPGCGVESLLRFVLRREITATEILTSAPADLARRHRERKTRILGFDVVSRSGECLGRAGLDQRWALSEGPRQRTEDTQDGKTNCSRQQAVQGTSSGREPIDSARPTARTIGADPR